jgi:hypothetical protein
MTEPKLAAPGAGLPWPQMLALRWYVRPFIAERADWDETTARFHAVTKKMEEQIAGLDAAQLTRKVLIPPQQSLEDSSRHWSAAMTLEHVVIVGRGVAQALRALGTGKTPPGKASTATVKPSGAAPAEAAVRAFRSFCGPEFSSILPSVQNRDSGAKFAHPWFGPLTARGWYWVLAAHHAVHLQQLREIKKGLAAG